MKFGVNTEIAFTYMISRHRQTIVAALGVTFGIGMFIFINSLIAGTNEWSEKIMLSSTPHLRLYNDSRWCDTKLLDKYENKGTIHLISNPRFVNTSNNITNPDNVIQQLSQYEEITGMSKQVSSNVIYSNNNLQENGSVVGVNIIEQDKMFDIASGMISGSVGALAENNSGIIIGVGLSKKLNVKKGDYITLATGNGFTKRLQIVGIFKTTVKVVDNGKSYTNIPVVQQLLQKDRGYITDIYINIKDYNKTSGLADKIQKQTGYAVETWQSTNEQSLAGKKIRDVIANAVVITILLVAGFGIYNILNMVIYEKMKEIAILKATGFQGMDVINIFIKQASFIGLIGTIGGLLFGWSVSYFVSRIYLGVGSVAYLPVTFQFKHYAQGSVFGLVTAFLAGYIPARKAAKVDPIKIIRG